METKQKQDINTAKVATPKKMKGVVVSDVCDKTITVAVARFVKHPKYNKYIKIIKKFKAHDEGNIFKKGDEVVIEECRPISKDKNFRVVK